MTPAELQRLLATNPDITLVTDGHYTTLEPAPVAAKLAQPVRRLTLDYPPSSNRYWRVYNNRVVRSDEATAYIRHVKGICTTAGIAPVDGDVSITLRVYRARRRGDLDNRVKIVLDALQGCAYYNDSQIVAIHATRHDDKANPRIELEITAL